jgi:hypothetical protein
MDHHGALRAKLYFLNVVNVRASHETNLWASTACYGVSFTSLFLASFVEIGADIRKQLWEEHTYRDTDSKAVS